MNWMLTNKEILKAYASAETQEFLSGSRGVAKAQAKKLELWGREKCDNRRHGKRTYDRFDCPYCMEQFLKEVNDG